MSSLPTIYCFSVLTDHHPSALPRVLEVFAAQNIVPLRCHADVIGPKADQLAIDLQVGPLDARHAEKLALRLSGCALVDDVLFSAKGLRAVA
ncbi:MAG: hypothetical protein ACFB3T_11080 [Geminicoccaceae bacterium]